MLHFDTIRNRIIVNTYSPYLNDYNFYDTNVYPAKDEFVMNLDLTPQKKQVATDYFAVNVYTDNVIGKVERVNSGGIARATWNNLKSNAWYAIVTDTFTGQARSDIQTYVKDRTVHSITKKSHTQANSIYEKGNAMWLHVTLFSFWILCSVMVILAGAIFYQMRKR
ncbi:hypothetical protein MUG87_00795 [Ectobacillus sp. JY-23]|uniref:hypothetical protein n=1 Tax=Ectobacillus sp. JY-23 TaxID=2933872 RepID=UPI001FF56328|nr:hypothetical protein [Ectobacillus sp. JY-23]UOY92722.1 hypothetical protein MUG87_00795 [Ectobacillus sp. JY-23]